MVLASPVIYGLNVHNKKYVCNSFGLRFHNFFFKYWIKNRNELKKKCKHTYLWILGIWIKKKLGQEE